MEILGILIILGYFAIIIYLISLYSLVSRLVHAVERIADELESERATKRQFADSKGFIKV